MKISIVCECGEKELLKSEENPYYNVNLYSEKFNVSGYDDGQAYISCKKCGKILTF